MTRPWRVSGLTLAWSGPAAVRAVRASIVIPLLFALTFEVIGDEQMTLFAVFGGFGALVMTSFTGSRRDSALAHLGLAVAGSITLTLGTLASSPAWLAVVATIPITFAVFAAGSAGPAAASAVSACLLAFVLPIASAGGASTVPSRLAGWWLAQAASTAAVLLLSPRSDGDRLKAQVAALAAMLSTQLTAASSGIASEAGRAELMAAKRDLMDAFEAGPYRPLGRAAADQSLASLIHLLEWCATLVSDMSEPGHLDLAVAPAPDRDLLRLSARDLGLIAALLTGEQVSADSDKLERARLRSSEQLQGLAAGPASTIRSTDYSFHAQAIGIAVAAALTEAGTAAGAAPAVPARQPGRPAGSGLRVGSPVRPARVIATNASLRSVWFRNSARGAIALSAAVAVAKATDVQHAFWVVLGTLSVLRTSAVATGATALRALIGTIAGFVVGGALLVAIGTDPTALWIIYPFAVFLAAYTPGTAPFAVGQAAFTIVVVILFNLLVPAGWKVGLLRVEDVAIGCAVSLVVGLLFWPRGASAVVGDNLADAFRAGSAYLRDAAGWALGDRQQRPGSAALALATAARLDDGVRGYLTEQGSKRLTKSDLWTLVMASTRLRLTAYSMASLPARPAARIHPSGVPAGLSRQLAGLSAFYGQLAAVVGKPARREALPQVTAELPQSGIRAAARPPRGGEAADDSDVLWVGQHLDHLESHAAAITGPAERLAGVRRRPWWR
jgi:uncharacterized membrane protein YccC